MSIGPTGIPGSMAGSPLAQSHGSDVDRAQHETSDQARRTGTQKQAEKASGIGQTEQDEQTSDRDADGRRPWELGREDGAAAGEEDSLGSDEHGEKRQSRDPTNQSGNELDLSG